MKTRTLITMFAALLLVAAPAVIAQVPEPGQEVEQPSENPDIDVDVSAQPPDVDVDVTGDTDADTSATGQEDLEADPYAAEEGTMEDEGFGEDESLPATASATPLAGLIGLAALALGGTLWVVSRRRG